MLLVAYWVLLFVFWFYILQFVKLKKYRLAGIATIVWAIVYFGLPTTGIAGSLYFISFEAILNFILIVSYQSAIRKASQKPVRIEIE